MVEFSGGDLKGTIFLPSYNRPHLVKRFITSYHKTGTNTPLWIVVDDADPRLEEYKRLELPEKGELKITKARTMGSKSRELWDQYKDFDYLIICNDDHEAITPNWDQTVISQLNGSNLIFTQDDYVNKNGPTRIAGAIAFSGKWLRALGYLFLPGMDHLYSDDCWQVLCQRPQCAMFLHDVVMAHRHAYLDKEAQDETFFAINGPNGLNPETRIGEGGFWPNDKKVFEEWMSSGKADRDIQKIMDIQPKTGVMIATPTHDGLVSIEYALGLSDFNLSLRQQNIHVELARVVGSSLIPHARNSLVDMFLKSKCQKLLFIDADQGFDAQVLWPLFSSPRRIIAGITPHKRFPINLNFDPLPEDRKYFPDLYNKGPEHFMKFANERADRNGEIEVNRCGTGVICIDRSVFEIMIKSETVEQYLAFDSSDEHKHWEFFKMGIAPGTLERYRGEDWFFCELAKKLSIPVYIQARSVATHSGMFTFRV